MAIVWGSCISEKPNWATFNSKTADNSYKPIGFLGVVEMNFLFLTRICGVCTDRYILPATVMQRPDANLTSRVSSPSNLLFYWTFNIEIHIYYLCKMKYCWLGNEVKQAEVDHRHKPSFKLDFYDVTLQLYHTKNQTGFLCRVISEVVVRSFA